MKYLQKIFLTLFSITLLFFFLGLESASSSFSSYENQIFEESNELKVKKLQNVFYELGLYDWAINGIFSDIKDELINYQIEKWIISDYSSYWAWYFWVRTIDSLEEVYWQEFLTLKEKYLKIEEPIDWERYFYVTAYYSPLPWQSRYTTGSYAWDIRLNGNGTNAASGKEVFTWLMAGPRNYAFWTKLYLEWIGIWSIEDRWWAIVNAGERWHEYDRIDIWMWYGDEWLERALKWGTRKVKWYIVDDNLDVTIEFDESPVHDYANLRVDPEEQEIESVKKLQQLLNILDLYHWEIDGDYEKVKNILIKYQIDNWIINSKYDEASGYFWPKTFATFRKAFWTWLFIEKHIEPWYDISLSKVRKEKMRLLKEKIDFYLQEKYNWDYIKIKSKKNTFKKALLKLTEKTKSITKKNELRYLEAIL